MICALCGRRVTTRTCRRYARQICDGCHFHHGLCRDCGRAVGRVKTS